MTSVALVVKMNAKSGSETEVAEFLTGAVDLANQEAGTPVWFALRTDESTFWIVDAFPSDTERQAHLDGPIAAALMENADRLLSTPPEILKADVLADKIPGS
ncbi:MAG: antibiotic biosynthesis monooxygenase [Actinomycetota bacterium]|nr:antibiotic biosynthesis monooxygenase [Actinomycetota bacterium]